MKRYSLILLVIVMTCVFTVSAQNSENHLQITLDNAASVSEMGTLEGHKGAVNSVTFSHEGLLLASGGDDKTARLWDMATMAKRFVLEGHEAAVTTVAFKLDDNLLASTGNDLNVLIWNTKTGTMTDQSSNMDQTVADFLDRMAGNDIGFHALTWLNDIPIAAGDGGISNFAGDISYEGGKPTFYSFDVSPNGLIATGESDGVRIALSNNNTGTETPVLSGHTGNVLSVKFDLDGGLLASGSADDTIRLWSVKDPKNVKTIATLKGHKGDVTSVAFSPDGTLLISSSLDGTLRLWNVETQELVTTLSGPEGTTFQSVVFSPDGTRIASAGSDGMVRLWGVGKGNTGGESNSISTTNKTEIVTSFGTISVKSAEFIDAYPKGCDPKVNYSCFAIPTKGLKLLMVYFDGVKDGTAFTDQHKKASVIDKSGNKYSADLFGLDAGLNFYGFAVPKAASLVNDFSLVWNDGEKIVVPLGQ